MGTGELLIVIAIGTFVIVGVSATGFFYFSRFLKKEEERTILFRKANGALPPDER